MWGKNILLFTFLLIYISILNVSIQGMVINVKKDKMDLLRLLTNCTTYILCTIMMPKFDFKANQNANITDISDAKKLTLETSLNRHMYTKTDLQII